MTKYVCVATCLTAFLLTNATVVRAGPARGGRQTTAGSPFLLSGAIDDYRRQLARAESRRPWDASQGSARMQLKKCESKKKGTIIGAVIGAAAGAAVAVLVVRAVSGVPGTSSGASTYIAYWSMGGAGAGALAGFAYCS
jgi:hypothetical protein